MAVDVQTVRATEAHAHALARTMRAADVAEVEALGKKPLDALLTSLWVSDHAFTLLFDGEPAAMWGVTEEEHGASVWALTGEAVYRSPKAFLRQSRAAVAVLVRSYPMLYNFVDSRYTAALRWAARLGFTVLPVQDFHGHPCHPIVIRCSTWDSHL